MIRPECAADGNFYKLPVSDSVTLGNVILESEQNVDLAMDEKV